MKKVIIIGASGSLASYVIEAIEKLKDVQLTLFVRSKKKLRQSIADKHHIIEGDAMNFNMLRDAIAGRDIVYINLAGNLETMARNIVKAMVENGVKRVIAISSIGIYEKPLRSILIPYRKLADVIEDSGLNYTILRPDWFTDGNEIDYALTKKGEPETGTAISRKSIAAFVALLIEKPDLHVNENLGISRPH
jgi:uncharacterized protein YbjT (DUF2867 family)